MEAKMQMIDAYVTKYSFDVKNKFSSNKGLNLDGKLNYRQLSQKEKENKKYIELEVQNDIVLKDKCKEDEEFGKISITIVGVFSFDKTTSIEETNKLLSINAVAILYQQIRAYISANTSLSNSVPNILIPILNLVSPNDEE